MVVIFKKSTWSKQRPLFIWAHSSVIPRPMLWSEIMQKDTDLRITNTWWILLYRALIAPRHDELWTHFSNIWVVVTLDYLPKVEWFVVLFRPQTGRQNPMHVTRRDLDYFRWWGTEVEDSTPHCLFERIIWLAAPMAWFTSISLQTKMFAFILHSRRLLLALGSTLYTKMGPVYIIYTNVHIPCDIPYNILFCVWWCPLCLRGIQA